MMVSLGTNSQYGYYLNLYTFNLRGHIENDSLNQNVALERRDGYSSPFSQFVFRSNKRYSVQSGWLDIWELDTGNRYYKQLDKFDKESNYAPELVFGSQKNAVFLQHGRLLSYDFETGEEIFLDASEVLSDRIESDFDGAQNKLVFYNHRIQSFGTYDTKLGQFLGYYPRVNDDATGSARKFGDLAVDWGRNIAYKSTVMEWNGALPSLEPIIIAYDLTAKTQRTVLTGEALSNQVGGLGNRLSIRRIAFNAASDELLLQIYSNTNTQYISSLSLNSKIIKTLGVFPISNTFGEVYMSRINSSFDTVAFAHWGNPTDKNGGGIDLFNFKSKVGGELTELFKAETPYYLTNRGVFNAEGAQYFGMGFKRDPLNPTVYQTNGELVAIDTATKVSKVLASEKVGLGLPLGWMEPKYDGNRDVLLDFQDSLLWYVDAFTGDRVVKPIELPAN
jgi:hypothetical protein